VGYHYKKLFNLDRAATPHLNAQIIHTVRLLYTSSDTAAMALAFKAGLATALPVR